MYGDSCGRMLMTKVLLRHSLYDLIALVLVILIGEGVVAAAVHVGVLDCSSWGYVVCTLIVDIVKCCLCFVFIFVSS